MLTIQWRKHNQRMRSDGQTAPLFCPRLIRIVTDTCIVSVKNRVSQKCRYCKLITRKPSFRPLRFIGKKISFPKVAITGTFPADIFLGRRASPKGVARGACPIVSKGLSSLKFLRYSIYITTQKGESEPMDLPFLFFQNRIFRAYNLTTKSKMG